jgi:hypothetical protein
MPNFKKDDWTVCPPGKWQYPGFPTQNDITALAQMVSREKGVKIADAKQSIYQHNCERLPDFFTERISVVFDRVQKAIRNAQ